MPILCVCAQYRMKNVKYMCLHIHICQFPFIFTKQINKLIEAMQGGKILNPTEYTCVSYQVYIQTIHHQPHFLKSMMLHKQGHPPVYTHAHWGHHITNSSAAISFALLSDFSWNKAYHHWLFLSTVIKILSRAISILVQFLKSVILSFVFSVSCFYWPFTYLQRNTLSSSLIYN